MLAAELVETTRLFARCAAKIEPEWIEEVAGDRVTRDYFEPHWDEARGEVVASERVQLYGLTLVARRPRVVRRHRPEAAREVFIREALVPGALATQGRVPRRTTAKLVAEVAELEHKARRQDVLVDDEAIAAFYAERIPRRRPFARDVRALARARPSASDPAALFMTRDDLMRHAAAHVTEALFPETLDDGGRRRCRSSIASRPAIRSTA